VDTGRRRRMARVSSCVALVLVLGACSATESPRRADGRRPSASRSPTTTRDASPRATPGPSPSNGHTRRPHRVATPTARPTVGRTTPASAPPHAGRPSAHDIALRTLGRLGLDQIVGQLMMVGIPATGTSGTVLAELADRHVGNVMLTGRSARGVEATAGLVRDVASRLAGGGG
jgi:beta-N-acetylhexosaminidase